MRILFVCCIALALAYFTTSCSNGPAKPASFCDTVCLQDTLKFTGDHETKPIVYITATNCKPDTIIWSYKGMEADRKTGFAYLLNADVNLNKDYTRVFFNGNTSAWILFNDCATGRGFQIKLPYDKKESFSLKSSGINNFDPKFNIEDNLIANTDRGNIYVEDMQTGKKAMMTFGQKLEIDYDALHEYIDSVNVTSSRVWVKVLIDKEWKVLEKAITLE